MKNGKLIFKRLACFLLTTIFIVSLNSTKYTKPIKADNETHTFSISPSSASRIYVLTKKKAGESYTIPNNNYNLDLSNTSKTSPAEITEFIYHETLIIKPDTNNTAQINDIKALDVKEGAVTITAENDNSYTLKFNSFFYDNVVFEITDSSAKKFYLKINRFISIFSTNYDNINDPTPEVKKVYANTYVKSTEEVGSERIGIETVVKKVYKDGSYEYCYANQEKINGTALAIYDDADKYRLCQFSVEVDSNVKELYFLISRPQWTSKTHGMITGSGMGVKYNIATKKTTY